ncbi:transmembrane emp24 domain-containing protein 6-like [Centruroides sculpturatus]|uniref:transmembrane emp24 domain-containing protein 6-like n=1 Tax=Centruroides sculpturatus TaxID=218467 RepID=UPI000C6D6258|nr:transmembrane emp24 domain-containing protein 6-like [Centruroides sculpturatus]
MATATSSVTSVVLLLLFVFSVCDGDTYTFDKDLGIAFEFKVHVDAGREECFYQFIHAGSTLFVAFQVMRGGDGMAGFAIRNPNGLHVFPYQWKPNAEYEEQKVEISGYYQLCIDNSLSRFASKLVSLYVNSFKRDEWESYIKELEEMDVTVANFTGTLKTVDERVGEMLKYQDQSRRQVSRDWYLVDANNRWVLYWSLAQCIVICITSTIQVVFVRKLFEFKNVTPTAKPRA